MKKLYIGKKYIFIIITAIILVLSIIIVDFLSVPKKEEEVTCYDYIVNWMDDIGWKLYNNNIFYLKSNEETLLVLNNNFITFKIKGTEDRLNVYLNDDIIYLNENKNKENINEYEKYKDYLKYDAFKLQLLNIHYRLDEIGCGLYGKKPYALSGYKGESIK